MKPSKESVLYELKRFRIYGLKMHDEAKKAYDNYNIEEGKEDLQEKLFAVEKAIGLIEKTIHNFQGIKD